MTRDLVQGVALGSLLGALAIGANHARGDAALFSVFPDLLTLFVLPVWLGILIRRRNRTANGLGPVRRAGLRVAGIAALVFAVLMAVDAVRWFTGSIIVVFVMSGAVAAIVGVAAVETFARVWTPTEGITGRRIGE